MINSSDERTAGAGGPKGAVVRADDAAIARAAAILRAGGLVAFPTETVYGLGADALDARAAAGIFAAKGRPSFDPLIVHVSHAGEARELWAPLPEEIAGKVRALAERFWPGPLTIVLPKAPHVPDIVTSGLPAVAVRVPDHAVARALIRAAGTPVAAPSANRFGRPSPTDAAAVADELGPAVDLILDGGPTRVGVESSVLGWPDGWGRPAVLLRPGGVAPELLAEVVGPLRIVARSRSDAGLHKPSGGRAGHASGTGHDGTPMPAPGMLDRHYAPDTPLYLLEPAALPALAHAGFVLPAGRWGLMGAGLPGGATRGFAEVVDLSPAGDLAEAAARLFATVRRLDAAGLDGVIAVMPAGGGLGPAIRDRLLRASVGRVEFPPGTGTMQLVRTR